MLIIICILLISCKPKIASEQVGNRFVTLYYQQMNQQDAIKLSDQIAKEKLEKEFDLVRENRIKNPQAPENRAKVSYKLEETKYDKDMGFLTYRLTIQPTGASPFDRTALITIQNENGTWKVINYEEINRE